MKLSEWSPKGLFIGLKMMWKHHSVQQLLWKGPHTILTIPSKELCLFASLAFPLLYTLRWVPKCCKLTFEQLFVYSFCQVVWKYQTLGLQPSRSYFLEHSELSVAIPFDVLVYRKDYKGSVRVPQIMQTKFLNHL